MSLFTLFILVPSNIYNFKKEGFNGKRDRMYILEPNDWMYYIYYSLRKTCYPKFTLLCIINFVNKFKDIYSRKKNRFI